MALFAVACLAPSVVSAHFTRPFLRQITGPFHGLQGGVAVDSADDLWVGGGSAGGGKPFSLNEFKPSGELNAFKETIEIEGESPFGEHAEPLSLAIGDSTSLFFYIAGDLRGAIPAEIFDQTGAYVDYFGPFGSRYVAVDNSTEPSDPNAGSVYVAQPQTGGKIYRFKAAGNPEAFSCTSCSYVSGNEITGTPAESFGIESPGAIAVDPQGDIYVVNNGADNSAGGKQPQVDEYKPSGEFIRAFTGAQTPGLGGRVGFGNIISGVAVDPLSGHLLVSVGPNGITNQPLEGAVDEFDSSTGEYLNQITEASPGHPLHGVDQITVDSHGDLYLAEPEEGVVDVWGPGHFLPSMRLAAVSGAHPTTAVLNGSVDPEELPVTDCHFEYVTQAHFEAEGFENLTAAEEASCVPAAASLSPDAEYQPVHAEVTGLTSGTTYRYRLLTTTSGALGGAAASIVLAFTAPDAPRVESTTVANLSSTFAGFHAQIDPLGADTTYRFEYLTQAEFAANGDSFSGSHPASAIPVPDADIGAGGPTGSSSEAVVQQVGGLTPGTVYELRVVATNEVHATDGPAETFATLPQVTLGLPDNRAYELVTPPDKGSSTDMFGAGGSSRPGEEFVNFDVGYASQSGDSFLLTTSAAAFGPFPAAFQNAYLFSRTEHGWGYRSLVDPALGVQSIASTVFDPTDFSQVGINDNVGSFSSPAGSSLTALLGPPGGPYASLAAYPPIHAEGNGRTLVVGANRDLSHVVLETNNHALCPGDTAQDAGSEALCEYSAGTYALLNVNSKGKLAGPLACGAVLGLSHTSGTRHDAVSADGSAVLFTAPDPYASTAHGGPGGEGCWNGAAVNAPQLYQRSAGQTLELSAPLAALAAEKGHYPAYYYGAADDGSRVFFASEARLTPDHPALHDLELYEWRSPGSPGAEAHPTESPATCAESSSSYSPVSKGCLIRVSRGESGNQAGGLAYVPAVSADGAAVYFVANGVLAANPGAAGAKASQGDCTLLGGGSCNLYRYDAASGATAYLATVEDSDYQSGSGVTGGWGIGSQIKLPQSALLPHQNWYATPNGRYLLFASRRTLTGYSTLAAPGAACNAYFEVSNGHCMEIYRYDAAAGGGAGELSCLSCNPTGAAPTANAQFANNAASGLDPAAGSVRALSDNGAYAYFDTSEALVPNDINGTEDVYEWHEGHGLSLISSGRDSAPSFFLGASADGSNVFFGTHAQLVPQDTNTGGDLYDARICTESDPCIKPPPGETAQCEGGSCQSPPPLPLFQTPATLTLASSGNVGGGGANSPSSAPAKTVTKKTSKCARPKKLSHGRCVKAKSKKKAKRASRERRAGS